MISGKNTEVMVELNRGSFRRAVSRISKVAPSCQNIGLVHKKRSTDMFIVASPSSTKYDKCYEDEKPRFDVCAAIHNVKGTIFLNIIADRIALANVLDKIKHSDEDKIFLSIKKNSLYLYFTNGHAQSSAKLPIKDMGQENQLKLLRPKKYVDEIQIEDFYMYFRETRHVLEARLKKEPHYFSFYLEIDTENNIRVTAHSSSHISVRGYVTGEIKYSFHLLKPDMVRIAALFDKEPVTIRIPKRKDNYLHLIAKDVTVSIPVVSHFHSRLPYIDPFRDEKPLLSLIFKKESLLLLIKNIMGYDAPPRIIVKGNMLEVFCGIEDGAHPIGHYEFNIIMEKSPNINIDFQIEEKQLYDAVYSINSYYIKFMFMPHDKLIVADYHRSSRMLPHTLKSLEIIDLPRGSFHIL